MTGPFPQMLRADAQENRDRVVEAARELFCRVGLTVTMREIARHAEVGPATLYRRFPTKEALVLEAFMHELHACRRIVFEAAQDPDPWRGFSSLVDRIVTLHAQNQGFTEAFFSEFPGAVDFTSHRAEMLRGVSAIARRAVQAGRLRADFVLDDFVLVLSAGRGLASIAARDRGDAARRFAALALDGLRADRADRPLPQAPRLVGSVIPSGA